MVLVDTRVSSSLTFDTYCVKNKNIKNTELCNQSKLTCSNNNLCIESVVKPLHKSNKKLKNKKFLLKTHHLTTSTPKLANSPCNQTNEMTNDTSLADEMTRSFLEKFFNRETNTDLNLNEKVIDIQQNENGLKQIDNLQDDEFKDKFLNFFFESKSNKSLNNSSIKQSSTSPRKHSLHKTNSDLNGILIYLANLKLNKSKLNSKVISNYLDLQKTLSDGQIRYYITKRSDCRCVQNALGCCLESFNEFHNEDFIDKCCQKCSNFQFYDYRLSDDSSSSCSNKFETEEPDWYKNLKVNSNDNQINEMLTIHDMLRTPNVHEFIIRSKCKCLVLSVNCCIKKIYNLLENKKNEVNLKEFIEYSCCGQCHIENEIKNSSQSNLNQSIFATKSNSIDSSLEESDSDQNDLNQTRNNNTHASRVDKVISQSDSNENSRNQNDKNESIIENKNESLNEKIDSKQTKDFDTQINGSLENDNIKDKKLESNETSQFLDFIFESKKLAEKTLSNSIVATKDNLTEDNHSKINENNDESIKLKQSLNLNNSNKSPTVSRKSSLKVNNSRSKMTSSSSKSVRFYDEKHGFMSVPIPEWQENLREAVYSKPILPISEWKTEIVKNDYEITKLKLSMSLNSQNS